jgi:predicted DNA-binding transcriptional regulator AlpA
VTPARMLSDGPQAPEALLTAAQTARIVGVSTKRLYELGIPAVRISERSLRWRPTTVAAWIAQREGTPTA